MGACFSSQALNPQPVPWEDLPPRQRLGLEGELHWD